MLARNTKCGIFNWGSVGQRDRFHTGRRNNKTAEWAGLQPVRSHRHSILRQLEQVYLKAHRTGGVEWEEKIVNEIVSRAETVIVISPHTPLGFASHTHTYGFNAPLDFPSLSF